MPKRKAHETEATRSAGSETGSGFDKSPNPRKKSKREALAAAKKWHDKREKSGGDATMKGSPGGSKRVTSQRATSARTGGKPTAKLAAGHEENNTLTTRQQIMSGAIPSRSPLLGEEKSLTNTNTGGLGGNVFLESLRKNNNISATSIKEEDVHSDSINAKPLPVSESVNGSANSSSNSTPVRNDMARPGHKNTEIRKSICSMGETILILFLLALNVAAAAYIIYDQYTSNSAFQEQYVLGVEKLNAELSKTLEVEALLRSGIAVLEQEMQANRNGMENLGEVPSLYKIHLGQYDGLLSHEEKGAWLERLGMLDVDKNMALDDMDRQLVDFGYNGAKEEIRSMRMF